MQTFFTLGSKVLGFARDLALNYRFGGQGPFLDAWATAQMMPNFFRRLFAEGAFAQAFVPVYGKTRTTEGDAAAAEMASQVLAFVVAVVVGVAILLEVAMPWLMPVLLSAYVKEPQTLATATLMAQLAMPYLICMTLASLFSGVLNTLGRFALSAGAPILLNVCTLVPLLLITDRHMAAIGAAAATTVSGVLQAGLLGWGVRRMGVKLRIHWPAVTKIVRRVIALAIPGAIAGGSMQLNTLVSQMLSGSDAGARAVLYNSDRLYQLPLSLIGVAVGLALVPRLSIHFAKADDAAASQTMDDGVGLSMAFTLPGTIALLVMPFFIIDATVTRGHFTSADAHRTAEVLRQFAWGVPAFVLAKVFTPPFFARQRTKQPMQFAITAVVVNTHSRRLAVVLPADARHRRHDWPWRRHQYRRLGQCGAALRHAGARGCLSPQRPSMGPHPPAGRGLAGDGRLPRRLRLAVSAAQGAPVAQGARSSGGGVRRLRSLRRRRFRSARHYPGRDQGRPAPRTRCDGCSHAESSGLTHSVRARRTCRDACRWSPRPEEQAAPSAVT